MMKMKKICAVIVTAIALTVLTALSGNTAVYADNGFKIQSNNEISLNDLKNNLIKEKQDKQKELADAMDKKVDHEIKPGTASNVSNASTDMSIREYSLDEAYKVTLITPLMITKYNSEQSFSSVLTDNVRWIVPVFNFSGEKGYATLIEKDNKIEWIGTSYGESNAELPDNIDSVLSKISTISSISTDGIKSIQYTYSQFYHTTFVYFNTADTEYIIPFSNIADQMNITNGKVYPAKNLFSILNKTFDESILIKSNDMSNAGLPFRNQVFSTKLVIIICVSLTALILIVLCVKFIFRKNKENDDLICSAK